VTTSDEPTGPADYLAAVTSMGMGTMGEHMGLVITEASPQRMVGSIPVERNTQPYGLLHGGASVALAETLGSVGSALAAGPNRVAVGIEINASHHRAAASGRVTGVATPVQLGRTLCTWEVTVSDDQGRRVCTARVTCMLRDTVPGG
jgi:1,4-dihydroxy-2-naphthoyl-CoA hydrolase